jgi:hypothetical protein
LIAALAAGTSLCGPPPQRNAPGRIEVEHEKLYLAPIDAEGVLSTCTGWPADKGLRELLLDNIRGIRANLIDELKRSQKYGLYTVVDSLHAPTVTIELAIVSRDRRGDTLFLPLEARVRHAAAGKTFTREIRAFGVVPSDSSSRLPAYQWLGHALADYRRRFPHRRFVGEFYSSKQN